MNFASNVTLRKGIMESVEKELGRQMTQEELNIFYRTSRITLATTEQAHEVSEKKMA